MLSLVVPIRDRKLNVISTKTPLYSYGGHIRLKTRALQKWGQKKLIDSVGYPLRSVKLERIAYGKILQLQKNQLFLYHSLQLSPLLQSFYSHRFRFQKQYSIKIYLIRFYLFRFDNMIVLQFVLWYLLYFYKKIFFYVKPCCDY